MLRQRPACLLLVGLVLLFVTSCADATTAEATDLLSNRPVESSISVALDTLDEMDLPANGSVLVPTNTSVLDLSAAALAGMASEGDLSLVLEQFVFAERIDLDALDSGDVLTTATGLHMTVSETPDGLAIGQGRVVRDDTIDGVHVIVLEGLFG